MNFFSKDELKKNHQKFLDLSKKKFFHREKMVFFFQEIAEKFEEIRFK